MQDINQLGKLLKLGSLDDELKKEVIQSVVATFSFNYLTNLENLGLLTKSKIEKYLDDIAKKSFESSEEKMEYLFNQTMGELSDTEKVKMLE